MPFQIDFKNQDKSKQIDLYAERVDMRMSRQPMVYDRIYKTAPKMRDLGKMRTIFLITAYIPEGYLIDPNASIKTAEACKDYLKSSMEDWYNDGNNGRMYFQWKNTEYVGLIMKIDADEKAGEENQYSVLIEFQEGQF